MATGNDLYDMSCSVPCVNDGSADDEEEDDEVMYGDLLVSGDLVTSQLASSGPIGLAAAAAIMSGKKRRRLHCFETNPSIRKRQQTRLLRKLCSLMEEYIVRVGQQAVIVCCTPKLSQAGSFRVYGSQPLEGIVKGRKLNIVSDLEKLMLQQTSRTESGPSDLFELPPLCVEGIPIPLERMTQAQLRYFIPEMLKYSTGKSKPGWGKPECRPTWWPLDVPWANVRSDVRNEGAKRETSWTLALRKIVKSCYKHHNREDLLDVLTSQNFTTGHHQSQQINCSSTQNYLNNSLIAKDDPSTIVVQQVTAPDGTIKLVQLDTSGITVVNNNKPTAAEQQQQRNMNAALSKVLEVKQEFEESNSMIVPETHNDQRKVIHLTCKRTYPFEMSGGHINSFQSSLAANAKPGLSSDGNISVTANVRINSDTKR